MIVENLEAIKVQLNEIHDKGFYKEANLIGILVDKIEATYINNFLCKVLKKSLTEDIQ